VSQREQALDQHESAVVDMWRKGHLCRGTIINYLYWVRRFRKHREKQKLIESEQLTHAGLQRVQLLQDKGAD
jgi:hypothetical protein